MLRDFVRKLECFFERYSTGFRFQGVYGEQILGLVHKYKMCALLASVLALGLRSWGLTSKSNTQELGFVSWFRTLKIQRFGFETDFTLH